MTRAKQAESAALWARALSVVATDGRIRQLSKIVASFAVPHFARCQ